MTWTKSLPWSDSLVSNLGPSGSRVYAPPVSFSMLSCLSDQMSVNKSLKRGRGLLGNDFVLLRYSSQTVRIPRNTTKWLGLEPVCKEVARREEFIHFTDWKLGVGGLPWGLRSLKKKKSACNAGDTGSIPELGRSPGGGHSNPLQDSCLENPMDAWAWQGTVHGVTKTWTQLKRLSRHWRTLINNTDNQNLCS